MNQKYKDVLESLDWSILDFTNDGRVEIQKYSPAGEDFCICVDVENFPEAVAEYAADFNVDEHIEMWVEAKKNGVGGVPSTRELVEDAEAIDKMLQELAAALYAIDTDKPQTQVEPVANVKSGPEISKMISLNVSHITGKTMFELQHDDVCGVITYPKVDPSSDEQYGAFVYIQGDWEDNCEREDLIQCIRFAKSYGCDWICFDYDANIVEDLPTYDRQNSNITNFDLPF